MLKIQNKKEFDDLIAAKELSIVDFYADWCGPCVAVAPRFVQLSQKSEFVHFKFGKVNIEIEDLKAVAAEYKIRSIPTFIIFQSGKELMRGHNLDEVQAELKKHLSK
jgi:thioredoxin 1